MQQPHRSHHPTRLRASAAADAQADRATPRAVVALGLVAVVVLAWQFWPFGGGGQTTSAAGAAEPELRERTATVTAGTTASSGPDSPIKHVIFIVKENRTFNNYFATYPGAVGSTTGGTLTCTDGVCTPGPDYS